MELPYTTVLLGIIALTLIVLTAAVLMTAYEMRRTLVEARELLSRTNTATRSVETALRRTYAAAAGVVVGIAQWQAHLPFWSKSHGNGGRSHRGGHHG